MDGTIALNLKRLVAMKKQVFIRSGNNIYVPPSNSWLENWTRQRWLERHFKDPERILVVSQMSWDFLLDEHKSQVLCENLGTFAEKDDG